jgi:hypothetical protein
MTKLKERWRGVEPRKSPNLRRFLYVIHLFLRGGLPLSVQAHLRDDHFHHQARYHNL